METERALHARIGFLSNEEQRVWVLDQLINDRGLQIDNHLANAAITIAATAQKKIDAELAELTGAEVSSVHQTQRLTTWLAAHGCEVKDVSPSSLKMISSGCGCQAAESLPIPSPTS
jgi:DNA polymerase bacteriophage-type